MRKVVAFLQARSDSSRLPGKVLKPILEKPMILHQLERIRHSRHITDLTLLTTVDHSDDTLAEIVQKSGFDIFRGSVDDVLDRFYQAAMQQSLQENDIIVRLTGDCPLHDASIIDEAIESFLQYEADYLANCVNPPLYPDGFDVEVFTFASLKRAHQEARKVSEREHATPYIRESGHFRVAHLQKEPLHPEWRLTVDEEEDFDVVRAIYEHFGRTIFSFGEIVEYLEKNPELLRQNMHYARNEGYAKSLLKDQNLG